LLIRKKNRPVALIQANIDAINHYAATNSLPKFNDLKEASESDQLHKEMLSAIQAEAKSASFSTNETIMDVYITPIEWTSDNELLTTSQKLRRKPLSDKFQVELDAMFAKF